jgi:NAD(P)-dependent dehydrogenase (short-subunit alcohol dehydrogenase family)
MGRGVSLGIAKQFAAEGYLIAMVARDAVLLAELEAELGGACGIAADAGDETSLRNAFAAIRMLGPVEVLVYNASAGCAGLPSELTPDAAIDEFRVNVLGALVSAQEVIPLMKAAGRGTILFTGGGLALNPSAGFASLSMGKAAIRSLAFSFAEELEPAGIHVATVTICGFVQLATRFDPDLIGGEFLKLHRQSRPDWQREIVYR